MGKWEKKRGRTRNYRYVKTGYLKMLAVSVLSMACSALAGSIPRRAVFAKTAAVSASVMLTAARAEGGEVLPKTGGYVKFCDEDVMSPKAHGTSMSPVQQDLRWNVDVKTAGMYTRCPVAHSPPAPAISCHLTCVHALGSSDRICNFNRHYAEYAGYWKTTRFLKEVDRDKPTVYYDSVTGKPLFVAPLGRTMAEFLAESETHGWPSFRDQEVVWENMRVLKSTGEAVSADGTHLGHNLPDAKGNRYCINLVCVAGKPV